MITFSEILVTLAPLIMGGTLNMMFVKKIKALQKYYVPMDGRLKLKDGKRLFGDNKTWKGFGGMIAITALTAILWGLILSVSESWEDKYVLYREFDNTLLFNLWSGALLGLAYVLSELPNSFIKRRLGVEAGRTPQGAKGCIYTVFDQTDSAIGCGIVISFLFWPLTFYNFLYFVVVAGVVHQVVHVFLKATKLKVSS